MQELVGHTAGVTDVSVLSSLPHQILTGSDDSTCRLWDIRVDNKTAHTYDVGSPVDSASFISPELFYSISDKSSTIWDLRYPGAPVSCMTSSTVANSFRAPTDEQLDLSCGAFAITPLVTASSSYSALFALLGDDAGGVATTVHPFRHASASQDVPTTARTALRITATPYSDNLIAAASVVALPPVPGIMPIATFVAVAGGYDRGIAVMRTRTAVLPAVPHSARDCAQGGSDVTMHSDAAGVVNTAAAATMVATECAVARLVVPPARGEAQHRFNPPYPMASCAAVVGSAVGGEQMGRDVAVCVGLADGTVVLLDVADDDDDSDDDATEHGADGDGSSTSAYSESDGAPNSAAIDALLGATSTRAARVSTRLSASGLGVAGRVRLADARIVSLGYCNPPRLGAPTTLHGALRDDEHSVCVWAFAWPADASEGSLSDKEMVCDPVADTVECAAATQPQETNTDNEDDDDELSHIDRVVHPIWKKSHGVPVNAVAALGQSLAMFGKLAVASVADVVTLYDVLR